MPRIMSTDMIIEKNRLVSDQPFALLFQADIAGAPVPYRLAAYSEDIVFHGLGFLRAPLTLDTLEEPSSEALVNLRVTLQNVTQELMELLALYWEPQASPNWQITIWQIIATQPDTTLFSAGEIFSTQQVSTDLQTAVFDLVAEGVTLTSTVPKRRYSTSSGFLHIPRRF